MSTVAYGMLTLKREQAEPTTSSSTTAPGVTSYVDTLAALVPAEVLSLHALMLSFTTKTETNQAGEAATTITEPGILRLAFLALCCLSIVFYCVSHGRKQWDEWDWARMLIPPLAFIGWTMIQKATAFDAVMPDLRTAPRYVIGVLLAVVLGIMAGLLAGKADQKDPGTDEEDPPALGAANLEHEQLPGGA